VASAESIGVFRGLTIQSLGVVTAGVTVQAASGHFPVAADERGHGGQTRRRGTSRPEALSSVLASRSGP